MQAVSKLIPPTVNTNELVQRFLLIGKSKFQRIARPIKTIPVIAILAAFFPPLVVIIF